MFYFLMSQLRSAQLRNRLFQHHLVLFFVSVASVAALYVTHPLRDVVTRISFSTAYPALALLVLTLALGPWRVLRRQRVPVSFDWRRDLGIWAGILTLVHTVAGQMVHLRGRPWLYYVYPRKSLHSFPLRHDLFGSANETGLLATLIVLALLATSNDLSLRALGTPGWKRLQRWNYAVFALAGAHTLLYQSIEKKLGGAWAVAVIASLAITLAMQTAGYLRRKQGQPNA